jgi:hypothetical protein
MANHEPYATAAGVESAIKAASAASKHDPSLTVTERIRLEHFRRLLSRVLSVFCRKSRGDAEQWMLTWPPLPARKAITARARLRLS